MREQPRAQGRMSGAAEGVERLLTQLFGDGVDRGIGSCLGHQRRLAQQLGTPSRAGGGRRVDRGINAITQVAGEVCRPAEREQHPATLGIGQRSRVESQRAPVEPDALFVGEALYSIVGGPDRPLAGDHSRTVRRELGPVPRDLGEMLGQGAGELRLRRLGDGTVQRDPVGRRQRRLDGVAGERMDEPVGTAVAEPIEQAVRDGLVEVWKAVRDGFAERGRDQHRRELAPDDRRHLHQSATVGRDALQPRPDDVEHRPWRPVRVPRFVRHRTGDLVDEQRVAPSDVEHGVRIGSGSARSRPGQLFAHLRKIETAQIEAHHHGRPQQVGEQPEQDVRGPDVTERREQEQRHVGHLVGEVAEDES